jgi:glycosyltransferase involved in cell wall biosynthesis
MAKPRISVVMAVYQGERYLSEAIESILFQTEPSFEFIIVDDASSDRSMEILKRYECTDKRIVIIRNEKNLGLGASLRVGSEAASGEYLARMDCDDLSPKNRFELQLEYLERHPEISILGGNHRLIDENGTDIGLLEYPNSSEIMRWNMLLGNGLIVSNGATMMRRDYLFQLGNYRDLRAAQDFELWSRTFAEKPFPIANIKEIVLCYRQHTGTITKKTVVFKKKSQLVSE